jgi:hypothetical protein
MEMQNVAHGMYDIQAMYTGYFYFFHIPPRSSLARLQLIRCGINSASFPGPKITKHNEGGREV